MKDDLKTEVFCSFCGLGTQEVACMIKGPCVYICDQCIACCQEIIEKRENQKNTAVLATASFPYGSMGEDVSE